MNEQRFKMKTLGAIFLISLLTFGCGNAGTTGGAQGDGSPTLGITSVQKVSPNGKPNFALNLMNKGLGFLFGNPVLAAPCAPTTFAHKITMTDGTIWIKQAYIIIDEIEFNFLPDDPSIKREIGPFAFDLTNNVDDPFFVPELGILKNITPDDYQILKVKVGRVDGPPDAPKNLGANVDAFLNEIFQAFTGKDTDRRPSIWIKGVLESDLISVCSEFKFFSDVEQVFPLQFFVQETINPSSLDVVFFVGIDKAFQQVDSSGTFVQDFESEIGATTSFGPGFIDGRTQFATGSLNASALSLELFNQFQLFTQPLGSFDGELALVPDPA